MRLRKVGQSTAAEMQEVPPAALPGWESCAAQESAGLKDGICARGRLVEGFQPQIL